VKPCRVLTRVKDRQNQRGDDPDMTHRPDIAADPTAELVARYDRPVPRYTSYPTAPHFGPGITNVRVRSALAACDTGIPVSLYIHIPYCHSLCSYCGCNTKLLSLKRGPATVAAYLNSLRTELAHVSAALPRGIRAGALHFGGGTPNVLTGDQFSRLIEDIDSAIPLAEGAEIAAELDPRGLTGETIRDYARAGLNRASLGVQTLSPEVQEAINRVQPAELVATITDDLRQSGIESLNFDLIYGLPLQTERSLARTMKRVLEMAPDRIALFGYAHVPWARPHQRALEVYRRAGPLERHTMFQTGSMIAEDAGYLPVGIDHFATPEDGLARALREGRLRRNFQGYTDDPCPALIGLGVSAISALPGLYWQNESGHRAWREALRRGHLPVARGRVLTPEDAFRRDVIEQLMCNQTALLPRIAAAHGMTEHVLHDSLAQLDSLAADGLVEAAPLSEGRVVIPPGMRAFTRIVCAAFDNYLDSSETRHAQAV